MFTYRVIDRSIFEVIDPEKNMIFTCAGYSALNDARQACVWFNEKLRQIPYKNGKWIKDR
jgi:hypothetical protein